VRNPADLDAGAVVAQRVLEPPFDRAVCCAFSSMSMKSMNDQARKVTQAELARDLSAASHWS